MADTTEFLSQVEALLKSGEPRDTAAQKILDAVIRHFDSETGTVHWLDKEQQRLKLAAQIGLPEMVLDAVRVIPVGKGIAGQTVQRGEPVSMCNLQTDSSGVARPAAKQTGVGGMICVPIRNGEAIIGAFGIGTARPHQYTLAEANFLEAIARLMGERLNVKSLARAIEPPPADPNSVAGLVDEAADAFSLKEFDRSLECLKRAHRLAPYEPRILLALGRYYGLRCEYENSQSFFEKAFQATGQKTETIVIAGEHAALYGRHDLARSYFDRALKQSVDLPDALVPMAEIHERHQQNQAALELVERALRKTPGHAKSLLTRARLYRQAKQFDDAEKTLLSFVNRPDAPPETAARGWNELGMIYDRLGRYEEAAQAFERCKEKVRPQAVKAQATQLQFQRHLALAAQKLTADDLHAWRAFGPQLPPSRRIALLCGHPRSGTTLLEQVLDAHPDMVSSEETMIFYNETHSTVGKGSQPDQIVDNLRASSPAALQQAREKYFSFTEKFFGKPIAGRLLIDKNPSYTAIIPGFARVFPESKYLVALRDPRDVVLSCYMQYLPVNPVSSSYLSIADAVTEYASLMGFWLALRDKMAAPWLEVRYEDMVDDLSAVARRTLEFLEMPWDERVLAFNEHAKCKIVRSPTYADVGKPIYKTSQGRWRHYQKLFEPHLATLEPFAKAFGYE